MGSKLSNTLYEVSNGGKRSEGKGRRKNDKEINKNRGQVSTFNKRDDGMMA